MSQHDHMTTATALRPERLPLDAAERRRAGCPARKLLPDLEAELHRLDGTLRDLIDSRDCIGRVARSARDS